MIETKFIEIVNNNGKNIIVGVIYRPPIAILRHLKAQ